MKSRKVEKHQITKNSEFWKHCDDVCFKTKNLYNSANYIVRQTFIITHRIKDGKEITDEQQVFLNWINEQVDNYNYKKLKNAQKKDKEFKKLGYFHSNHTYISYNFLEFLMSSKQEYKDFMAKVAQQTLKLLDKDWVSFFEAIKVWKREPDKFLGRPKLPNYAEKDGRKTTIFTNQDCKLKDGYVFFPKKFESKLGVKTKQDNLQQVRIVPKGTCYTIEIVYNTEIQEPLDNNNTFISIDLGLNNFATIVNNIGNTPIVINGKIMKSTNQFYNKKKLKSFLKLRRIIKLIGVKD